jgi:hypothetical protein
MNEIRGQAAIPEQSADDIRQALAEIRDQLRADISQLRDEVVALQTQMGWLRSELVKVRRSAARSRSSELWRWISSGSRNIASKIWRAPRRPGAFWLSVCNVIGPIFNMVGVWLLFRFALPNAIPGTGFKVEVTGGNAGATWLAENYRYTQNAYIGLGLILLGTIMEAVFPSAPPAEVGVGGSRCARRSLRSLHQVHRR